MTRFATHGMALLVAATTALSCGGGGDAGGVLTSGPSDSYIASFTADEPTPENESVSLSPAPGGGGSQVTVNVGVTGVTDVFGASFRITYDPALVEFDNWSRGSLFEGAGESALYQVSSVSPGVVEVGVSCAGCPVGIDVTSTANLVQLIFSAVGSGSSSLSFAAPDLLDAQSPPGPIAGLAWDGGTITGVPE